MVIEGINTPSSLRPLVHQQSSLFSQSSQFSRPQACRSGYMISFVEGKDEMKKEYLHWSGSGSRGG